MSAIKLASQKRIVEKTQTRKGNAVNGVFGASDNNAFVDKAGKFKLQMPVEE